MARPRSVALPSSSSTSGGRAVAMAVIIFAWGSGSSPPVVAVTACSQGTNVSSSTTSRFASTVFCRVENASHTASVSSWRNTRTHIASVAESS